MIQASAKYLNPGINFETPPCNRSNKTLPKGKIWSPQQIFFKPIPQCIFKFHPRNFSSPRWENNLPNRQEEIKTLTFHNQINMHIAGDSAVYSH